MAHTEVSILFHCVFSTKARKRLIPVESQGLLWAYMGGIARNNGMRAMAIGGTEDHAHLLLSLRPDVPVAKAIQLIKSGSSKWFSESHNPGFSWQSGYGAFTIGTSQKAETIAYIDAQVEHHQRIDFRQEYLSFLRKNGVDYDERYLWT